MLTTNVRSAVEAWSHTSPTVKKWTKHTVAKHISIGGMGPTPVGTAMHVADVMEQWVEEAGVDGFNLVSSFPFIDACTSSSNSLLPIVHLARSTVPSSAVSNPNSTDTHTFISYNSDLNISPFQPYVLFPQSFKDIIDLLLPELRARGLFWDDYAVPGGTYRENFYQSKGQTGPLKEHVASTYRWRAGVEEGDHRVPG